MGEAAESLSLKVFPAEEERERERERERASLLSPHVWSRNLTCLSENSKRFLRKNMRLESAVILHLTCENIPFFCCFEKSVIVFSVHC